MKMNLSQTFLKGGIIASLILGVSLTLGGYGVSAAGIHGHGGMLPTRGFDNHHISYGPHHGGFTWIGFIVFLIVGIAVVIFLMKWFKKGYKSTAMEQFIQTTIASPYKPLNSQKEDILDQWEKEVNKKGNN